MSDVIVPEKVELMESDVLNPSLSIDQRLNLASHVANKFKTAIEQLGLIQKIQGREYVTVSGWSTLGTMLGIHVENINVEPFPVQRGYAYRAKLDLVDKNGVKIGEGEAIATSTGRQKEAHAVYSMAITRATGKAYRLCLAWLVEMAGYNATPYEEMPEEMTERQTPKRERKKPEPEHEPEPVSTHEDAPQLINDCIDALMERGRNPTVDTIRMCIEDRAKDEDELQECLSFLENINLEASL